MKEFTLLLLAHIVGDYYLQPQWMAKLKSKHTLYVLIHAGAYALSMLAALLLYRSEAFASAVVISLASHAAIDLVKQLYLNHRARKGLLTISEDRVIFILDQVLHLSIITALSFWSASRSDGAYTLPFLEKTLPTLIGRDAFTLLACAALALAVMKPANVFIAKLLLSEKPSEQQRTRLRHGSCIGSLERLVTIMLLIFAQYAAIAIVFTAKSIARFKDFETREFAEYYLYGTLLSVAFAVIAFAVLRVFGTL